MAPCAGAWPFGKSRRERCRCCASRTPRELAASLGVPEQTLPNLRRQDQADRLERQMSKWPRRLNRQRWRRSARTRGSRSRVTKRLGVPLLATTAAAMALLSILGIVPKRRARIALPGHARRRHDRRGSDLIRDIRVESWTRWQSARTARVAAAWLTPSTAGASHRGTREAHGRRPGPSRPCDRNEAAACRRGAAGRRARPLRLCPGG